jgi:hypothetical protein
MKFDWVSNTAGSWNWGFIVAGVGVIVIAIVWFADWHHKREIRATVFASLDNALHGGQFAEGGYLHGANALEIAYDMHLYCEDVAGTWSDDEIFPYVEEWLRERGPK